MTDLAVNLEPATVPAFTITPPSLSVDPLPIEVAVCVLVVIVYTFIYDFCTIPIVPTIKVQSYLLYTIKESLLWLLKK